MRTRNWITLSVLLTLLAFAILAIRGCIIEEAKERRQQAFNEWTIG